MMRNLEGVLAVKSSSEAVPEALTQCEQETRRFSLLSLFPGGGLPRVPCGLVELCGFMAKVTKVDEKASDEEVAVPVIMRAGCIN